MTGIFHSDEQMILRIGFKLIYKKVEAQLIVFERNRFYDDLIVRSIQDAKHMREAKQYCDRKGYDFVWFCKDVEQVYIGKRVDDSQKKKEAALFKARKLIGKVDPKRLLENDYHICSSNIMSVLDRNPELTRKD